VVRAGPADLGFELLHILAQAVRVVGGRAAITADQVTAVPADLERSCSREKEQQVQLWKKSSEDLWCSLQYMYKSGWAKSRLVCHSPRQTDNMPNQELDLLWFDH
jgi:hypothetical protein